MPESSVMQKLRRRKDDTLTLLNEESFNVSVAFGKLAEVCDITCSDIMGSKLVKVCLDTISKHELNALLTYDGFRDEYTIIQVWFWRDGEHQPFYRPKLRYMRPNQTIPALLQKLVK